MPPPKHRSIVGGLPGERPRTRPETTTVATQDDLRMRKPDGWTDKSVLILSAPAGDRFPPSVVVTREALPPDQSTGQFAEAAALQCAIEFDGFVLLDRDPASVDRQMAPAFRFRWDSPRGRSTHRQVYLPGADDTVLCVTFSSLTPDEATARDAFEEVLASMQVGRRDE